MKKKLFLSSILLSLCLLLCLQSCGQTIPTEQPTENTTSQESSSSEASASEPAAESATSDSGTQDSAAPKEEAPKEEAPKEEAPKEEAPKEEPPSGSIKIGELTQKIATSVCSALFRCCSSESRTVYFAAFKNNPNLKTEFGKKLPPEGTVDAKNCPALVKSMIDIVPFGDWVKAVQGGYVTFDAAAAKTCLDTMDNAACGKDVRAALFDSTCFGFSAPLGGSRQRKAFKRKSTMGDKCVIIRDGVGSGFFGSCNPDQAFCCYPDAGGDPKKCSLPKAGSKGVCTKAAADGEACKLFPAPILVCQTGLSCSTANKCETPTRKALNLGETCAKNFNLLGSCKDSWCDLTGSKKCEPLKADGEKCGGAYECKSEACNKQKCGPSTLCVGP